MHAAIVAATNCHRLLCRPAIAAIVLSVASSASVAPALEIQWNGGVNQFWHNVNNWDPVSVPPLQVHRVPNDNDTATLSTPAGDTVVLGADTAPINGLLVTNNVDLLTNGFLLEVDDAGSASTAIAGNGTTISVAPRTGGGTAMHTDGLFISGDGLLSVDGGDVQIDGMTTLLSGGRINSVAGGAIQFGGNVLAADSNITASPVSFSPNVTVTAQSNALVRLLQTVNVIDGMAFEVHTGARLEPTSLNIGNDGQGAGSTGSVVVDSVSVLDVASDLTVGHAVDGSGLLHVANAAADIMGTTTVHATGTIQLEGAAQFGAHNNVLVDGGTITTTGSDNPIFLDAGVTMTATNDAEVTIDASQVIGAGTGLQFDAGADLSVTGDLRVGNSLGRGILLVDGGGSTFDVGGELIIGRNSAQPSSVTLSDGAMGEADSVVVGQNRDAELTVASGAQLTSTSLSRIGMNAGVIGEVTVTGNDSLWAANGGIRVGEQGTGSLQILDGGSVTSGDTTTVGFMTDFGGGVTVDGAGSTFDTNSLTVGHFGSSFTSLFTVQGGGSVTSTSSYIGRASSSKGLVIIDGSPSNESTWTVTGRLSIGGDASTSQNGGEGVLRITSGGSVSVSQEIVLFPDGLLLILGGTLTTTAVSFEGGGAFDWNAGTLHVETFHGNLLNEGGTFAPGESAGGTTVIGDYTQQAGATLQIEVSGTATATQYDFVNVTGTAMLGGELELALIDGFFPDPDDEFIVLNAASLLGFFSNAGSGQRVDTFDGLGSFLVHYGPTSPFNPNQIWLTEFVLEPLPGDYNGDGTVDAGDYVRWRNHLGDLDESAINNSGDGGGVTLSDYAWWKQHYGDPGSGSGGLAPLGQVPEPAPAVLAIFAVVSLGRTRASRDRR